MREIFCLTLLLISSSIWLYIINQEYRKFKKQIDNFDKIDILRDILLNREDKY